MSETTSIVTAAGDGIGAGVASWLAATGRRVLLNDLDPDAAHATAEKIRAETPGADVIVVPGDATTAETAEQLVARAVDAWGRLDEVVCVVGTSAMGDLLDVAADDVVRLVNTNLTGTLLMLRAAGLKMKEQTSGGSAVLISSCLARVTVGNFGLYSVTKAGVSGAVSFLSPELAGQGIRLNGVAPGPTRTVRSQTEAPDYARIWGEVTPDGSAAEVDDIAHAVAFLLEPASRHVIGQVITVDGGWTRRGVMPPAYQN